MIPPTPTDGLVEDYLARVRHALRDLPRAQTDSMVKDLREHIQTARRVGGADSAAQVRQLLEDMGDPEAIRAAAGLPPVPHMRWGDLWAPWLLLFGGFVFLVGWLAGAVLLWNSSVWTTREKILATLIWPGGLAAVLYAGGIAVAVAGPTTCTGGTGLATHCASAPGSGAAGAIVAVVVAAAAVAAPIAVSVRLFRALRTRV